ncbi:MAG: YcxB family protein [Lachnospiraceae bacterium]|nr:YcxB family protein [Lachnospiraceae bacterium]
MGKRYEIQLTRGDMFRFQLRHTYTSIAGIVTVLLSLAGVYMLVSKWNVATDTYKIALLFVALYAPVVEPVRLFLRAAQQVKSPTLAKAIGYEFEEEGVILSQDTDRVVIPWERVSKIIPTRSAIYMYLDKVRGYILPVRNLQGDEQKIVEYMMRMREAHKE